MAAMGPLTIVFWDRLQARMGMEQQLKITWDRNKFFMRGIFE